GGIRDFHVTGVQTCALPIFSELPAYTVPARALSRNTFVHDAVEFGAPGASVRTFRNGRRPVGTSPSAPMICIASSETRWWYSLRSEERRVGKEGRRGWWRSA